MKNESRMRILVLFACAVSLTTAVRADFVTIDLSPFANSDLTTFTGGYNYPQQGGSITVDGIPFILPTIGANQDTGVVFAYDSASIPIGLYGVTSADVLANSAWGVCGIAVGEIDFVGSVGTFHYTLTEGDNIRDHFNGGFCNSAPNISGTANFGPDRLDLHSIQLPASFADETLESIAFVSYDQFELGTPFLAGLTVDPDPPSSTPEPSSLLFAGIGAIAIVVKRRLQGWPLRVPR
jgi:PEP-CTERM motif